MKKAIVKLKPEKNSGLIMIYMIFHIFLCFCRLLDSFAYQNRNNLKQLCKICIE